MSSAIEATSDPIVQALAILREQLQCAIEELDESSDKPANVHAARKQIKRARAMLRLLRGALGDDVYRRENLAMRDAARRLSPVRDAEILLDTLDAIVDRDPVRRGKSATRDQLKPFRESLLRQRATLRASSAPAEELTQIQEALLAVRNRLQRTQLHRSGWPTLTEAFRNVYRKGRKALATAQSDRSTDTLHEWRKQAKYLWHQLQAIEPLQPVMIGELVGCMHRLSDYLGDDHDLAVLLETVDAHASDFAGEDANVLTRLIKKRRSELQEKAFVLGERVFSDRPKQLERRLTRCVSDQARAPAAVSNANSSARHRRHGPPHRAAALRTGRS